MVRRVITLITLLAISLAALVAPTHVSARNKSLAGKSINFLTIQPHAVAGKYIADLFEKETGAHVQVLVVPYANVTEKALLDVTSGAGEYDVVEIWYPSLGQLASNGVLVDLTDWWKTNTEKFKFNDFVKSIVDPYTLYDGKRWALPYDGDTHILYYNQELLKKFGVTVPTTWDEYLQVTKTITEKGKAEGIYGSAIQGAKVPIIIISTFANRLGGYGGAFLDKNGKPVINSPEAVAALQALLDELPYALPDPKAVAFDEAIAGFTSGKVAFMEFWTDLGQISDSAESSKIVGKWGVAPMLKGTGPKATQATALNAGFSLGISTKAQDPETARAFIEFLAHPDINVKINSVTGGIDPTRITTFDNADYRKHVTDKVADTAKAALSNATAWPGTPKWPELQEVLTENLAAALAGSKTAKQALDDTQAKWEKILAAS